MLEEARLLSQHARKKNIDVSDVRLGAVLVRERTWARPPARLLLSQLAGSRNKTALPVPAVKHGVRLPPDRFSLTAPNFRSDYPAPPLDWAVSSVLQAEEETESCPGEELLRHLSSGLTSAGREPGAGVCRAPGVHN